MLDVFLLEVAQGQDAAGQDGPEFLLLELAFLQHAFVYLVFEGALREFPEGVDFEVAHAVLFLLAGDQFEQGDDVPVVRQLLLPVSEQTFRFFECFAIMAADFPQQKLFFACFALEVAQTFVFALLDHLEVSDQTVILIVSF